MMYNGIVREPDASSKSERPYMLFARNQVGIWGKDPLLKHSIDNLDF